MKSKTAIAALFAATALPLASCAPKNVNPQPATPDTAKLKPGPAPQPAPMPAPLAENLIPAIAIQCTETVAPDSAVSDPVVSNRPAFFLNNPDNVVVGLPTRGNEVVPVAAGATCAFTAVVVRLKADKSGVEDVLKNPDAMMVVQCRTPESAPDAPMSARGFVRVAPASGDTKTLTDAAGTFLTVSVGKECAVMQPRPQAAKQQQSAMLTQQR